MFCFSGTLFHSPNCVLIIQSCDSSPVVLERLQKVLLANVKAMAISKFESDELSENTSENSQGRAIAM